MLGLLVPLRADELGIAIGAIGVLVAARSAAETVLAVPLSALIARLGTKGAFVLSTSASAVVAALFAFAEGFWTMLLLNVAIGAARALGWVASQTYIAGQYDPAHRARDTGRFSFVSNLSQMVTPLMVGGAAAAWGYQAAFLVVAAYCALFAVNGLALAPTRRTGSGERVKLRAAAGLFRLPRMQMAMLLTFVRLWVPNIWTPLFPLLMVSAGGTSPHRRGGGVRRRGRGHAGQPADRAPLAVGRPRGALHDRPRVRRRRPGPLAVPAHGAGGVPACGIHRRRQRAESAAAHRPGERGRPEGPAGPGVGDPNAVTSFSAALGPLGTGWLVASLGAATAFPVAGGVAALLLGGVLAIRRTVRAA